MQTIHLEIKEVGIHTLYPSRDNSQKEMEGKK